MNKIHIALPYSGDISVNRYLSPRKNGGFYIRDTAKIWGMVLRGSLNYCLPDGFKPEHLKTRRPFDLEIRVDFPRRFSRRSGDPSNFDKFIRDVVAATLGVDDAGTPGEQSGTYNNQDKANIDIVVVLNFKNGRRCEDRHLSLL